MAKRFWYSWSGFSHRSESRYITTVWWNHLHWNISGLDLVQSQSSSFTGHVTPCCHQRINKTIVDNKQKSTKNKSHCGLNLMGTRFWTKLLPTRRDFKSILADAPAKPPANSNRVWPNFRKLRLFSAKLTQVIDLFVLVQSGANNANSSSLFQLKVRGSHCQNSSDLLNKQWKLWDSLLIQFSFKQIIIKPVCLFILTAFLFLYIFFGRQMHFTLSELFNVIVLTILPCVCRFCFQNYWAF